MSPSAATTLRRLCFVAVSFSDLAWRNLSRLHSFSQCDFLCFFISKNTKKCCDHIFFFEHRMYRFFFNLSPSCCNVGFKTLLLFFFINLLPFLFQKFLILFLLARLERRRRAIGSRPTFFLLFLKFHPTTSPDKKKKKNIKICERKRTHSHAPRARIANREPLRCRGQCTGNKYSHSEKSELAQASVCR